ncbi:hypothetical protein WDW89_05570 [Deltaproteobacteria bacterium TL4]
MKRFFQLLKLDRQHQSSAIKNRNTELPSLLKITGELLKDQPLDRGVTGGPIESYDEGIIPGVIEHWHKDIAHRKQNILQWSPQTRLRRISNGLRRISLPPDVSGQEISQLHPSPATKKLLSKLRKNPQDHSSRQELIRLVGNHVLGFMEKGEEVLTLKDSQILFLQALMICSFDELRMEWLETALWAQKIYMEQLQAKCRHDLDKTEYQIKTRKLDQTVRKQLLNYIQQIQINLHCIQEYQKCTTPQKNDVSTPLSCEFHTQELRALLEDSSVVPPTNHFADPKTKQLKIKNALDRLIMIINVMRFVPLLHPQALSILELACKVEPNSPIPYFLQARVNMVFLLFTKGRMEAGHREPQVTEQLVAGFQIVYSCYHKATQKVGLMPESPNEITVMIEYANVVCFISKVSKLMSLTIPNAWLEKALSNSWDAVKGITDVPFVEELKQELIQIGEDYKFDFYMES